MGLLCKTLLGLGLLSALTAASLGCRTKSQMAESKRMLSQVTPYSNCGFTGALLALQLGDCDEWPCVLKRGSPIDVEVMFKAIWSYHSLKTTINALFGGIAIPLYVDEHMCKSLLFGKCPADIGDSLSYLANMTVAHDLPSLSVTLEWIITNGDGDTVVCAQVPARFQ